MNPPILEIMAKNPLYLKVVGDAALTYTKTITDEDMSPINVCIRNLAIATIVSQICDATHPIVKSPKDRQSIIHDNLKKDFPIEVAIQHLFKTQPINLNFHRLLTDSTYFDSFASVAKQYCFLNPTASDFVTPFTQSHDKFQSAWEDAVKEKDLSLLKQSIDTLEKLKYLEKLKNDSELFEEIGQKACKFIQTNEIRIDNHIYACIQHLSNIYVQSLLGETSLNLIQTLSSYDLFEALKLLEHAPKASNRNFTDKAKREIYTKLINLKSEGFEIGNESNFIQANNIMESLERLKTSPSWSDFELKECQLLVAILKDSELQSSLLYSDRLLLIEIVDTLKSVLFLKSELPLALENFKNEEFKNPVNPEFSQKVHLYVGQLLKELEIHPLYRRYFSNANQFKSLALDKNQLLQTLDINKKMFDENTCSQIAAIFSNKGFRDLMLVEDKPFFDEVMLNLQSILNNHTISSQNGPLIQCKYDLNYFYK